MGGYAKAANRERVTPQAVKKAVDSLQRYVGRPLLLNRRGKLLPTKYALELMPLIDDVITAYGRFDLASQGGVGSKRQTSRENGYAETVRVAATSNVSGLGSWLETTREKMLSTAPCLGVRIYSYPDEACLSALERGAVDLAVTPSVMCAGNLVYHVLSHCPLYAVAVPDHPLVGRSGVTLADVCCYPLAGLCNPSVQDHVEQRFQAVGLHAKFFRLGLQTESNNDFCVRNGILLVGNRDATSRDLGLVELDERLSFPLYVVRKRGEERIACLEVLETLLSQRHEL